MTTKRTFAYPHAKNMLEEAFAENCHDSLLYGYFWNGILENETNRKMVMGIGEARAREIYRWVRDFLAELD